jgi:hypothetical protein
MRALGMFATGLSIKAFVTMKLFNWFIVPISNLPELEIFLSCGFVLLAAYLTPRLNKSLPDKNKKGYFKSFKKGLNKILADGFFSLVIGYVLSLFI